MKGDSLGDLEQLVMFAVLRLNGSGTAQNLRDEIQTRTRRQTSISLVYGTLNRLHRRRLLRRNESPGKTVDGRRRDLHFYTPTRAGVNALRSSYQDLVSIARGVKF
jgi:DNA-binding PadR family transcriptional regulator